MNSVCGQCGVRAAVKVLGNKPWCEQCAASPTMTDPALPTIDRLEVRGETRSCVRCNSIISAIAVTCPNCNYSELALVELPAIEEEKAQVVPDSLVLDGECRCWKCPKCNYEYNQDKTCIHCKAQKPPPALALSSQRNGVSLPVGPMPAKDSKFEALGARMRDESPESVNYSEVVFCEKCGEKNITKCQCIVLARWECVCNKLNPIYKETCENCGKPYETSVKSPWKCINCCNRTSIMDCDNCGCGKGWRQYLRHHNVKVNSEGWMWQCKKCYLWSSFEASQCFCGEVNSVIQGGLQGSDNRPLKKKGFFGF